MYHSNEFFARAQIVIPGGVNSPVRAFKAVGGNPIYMEFGKGAYLFDIKAKKYIDYVLGFGPLILGHAHPTVLEAITSAIKKGLGFGTPTPIEIEIAERISKALPSIAQLRMVTSGTEATQSAIRLARGFTGRPKIVKFQGCYHGHNDSLLVSAGSGVLTLGIPDSLGIPEAFTQHTLIAPYNDLSAVKMIFETYGEDIAAIIVEPVAANMNLVLPTPEFLPGLSALCRDYGSLLIFDEVITGFRQGFGGAQTYYDITPDLTCLGKIIGGGLPIGAFGGRREIMEYLAPVGPVYQAGTLSGNPVVLTAGLTTLNILEEENQYSALEQNTHYLMKGLKKLGEEFSIPLQPVCKGSMFGLFFTEEHPILNFNQVSNCSLEDFKQFFHGMLQEGIYLAPSAYEIGFLSTAHTQSDLDYTLEAARKVFKGWR
jgi:glutamate-1-semialdehyde 2,1-aminomutase